MYSFVACILTYSTLCYLVHLFLQRDSSLHNKAVLFSGSTKSLLSITITILLFFLVIFSTLLFFSTLRRFWHRILHIQITLIKKVQSNIPILRTTRITPSIRIHTQRIDGSEVTLHLPKLLLIHQMKKSRLEFPHIPPRRRHTHRLLSTPQQYMILRRMYHRIIHRPFRLIRLQMMQIHHIIQLSRKIRRTRNKKRLLLIKTNPINLLFMRKNLFQLIARHGIVQPNRSIVKGHKERLVQIEPYDIGRIDAFAVVGFG
mmetsp:Transcript_6290/g.8490  ORF Transcript_6290/g.8490 Transcript_6290/m.8490 type:complete len:258 (-) Transcript_6290:588-1361(-)